MSKFYSQYNRPPHVVEPACPTVVDKYALDSQGEIIVVGKDPFYERIQSHYESTRLDRKIEQFKRGNYLALGVPSGQYGDYSNVPTNLAEVLQARDAAHSKFDKLPDEIKQLFGNDYGEFIKSIENGTYRDKLAEFAAAAAGSTQAAGTGVSGAGSASGKGTEGGNQ